MLLRYVVALLVGSAGLAGASGYFIAAVGSETVRVIGDEGNVSICSFNIQFVGHFLAKEDEALAGVVQDCDIVVVQELVAPPMDGTYPDGDTFSRDPQSVEFFDAMQGVGFEFVLSEEDTGTNDVIHRNTSATEWFVTFYKPLRVQVAGDLPSGFLAEDRSNNDDYERVPYAFAFRTPDGNLDFVLISVHLKPGDGPANRARRKEEMGAIAEWIDANNNDDEQDFIILGDMNLQNRAELIDITPPGLVSINNQFLPTDTQLDDSYDHVMMSLYHTSEVDLQFGFLVLDLREALAPAWAALHPGEPYPGDPYVHNAFRIPFSDHNPVVFKLVIPTVEDDD